MTFALLAIVVMTGAANTSDEYRRYGPDGVPLRLVISLNLQEKLGTLASGLHHEVILCLSGNTAGDSATAMDFYMPQPRMSTIAGAASEQCAEETVALWHNHPPFAAENATLDEGSRVARPNPMADSRQLCALSRDDVEAARRVRLPFMAVSVDESTWCWWNLDQIDSYDLEKVVLIPALPGQRSWH